VTAFFLILAAGPMVSLKFDDIRKLEQRFSGTTEVEAETLDLARRVETLKKF
jgi:hypothetical protein